MKGKEELSFVWLLLGWGFFVLVVVVTTFSIGVSIKKPNLLHCWLTTFSFPKHFPDPEKQRFSENSKKVLTTQLFQAVSSAEDTNKLWCTKSQGSQWNFWELDALKEQLSLGVEDDPEHPSVACWAMYLQHLWLLWSSLSPVDCVCSCLSALQAVQECGISLGYHFWVSQKQQ